MTTTREIQKNLQTKEEIEAWLRDQYVTNYSIKGLKGNHTVDVYTTARLRLGPEGLVVKFDKVRGDFVLEGHLTTPEQLKNFPRTAQSLHLKNNNLTTLEHVPTQIIYDIQIFENPLENLKGLPSEIQGSLVIHSCGLKSLEGAPLKIGVSLSLLKNNLTNLNGFPLEIGKGIDLAYNELTSLKGLPEKVWGNLSLGNNKLETLEFCSKHVEGQLYLSFNPLHSLTGFPEYVKESAFLINTKTLSLGDILSHAKVEQGFKISHISNKKIPEFAHLYNKDVLTLTPDILHTINEKSLLNKLVSTEVSGTISSVDNPSNAQGLITENNQGTATSGVRSIRKTIKI